MAEIILFQPVKYESILHRRIARGGNPILVITWQLTPGIRKHKRLLFNRCYCWIVQLADIMILPRPLWIVANKTALQ